MKNKKLLVLTSRDIFSHAGERSLMLGKELAFQELGIKTYYFCTRFKGTNENAEGFNVVARAKTEDWLFRPKTIITQLEKLFNEIKPDILLVSGSWFYIWGGLIGRLAKKYGIKISLDMQGVLEEIKEYKMVKDNAILSYILYFILKLQEKTFIYNYVNLIELVSENGREYIKNEYPEYHGKIAKISCGFTKAYSDDEYTAFRNKWRGELGLDDNKISVVYAGSLSFWQRKDKMLEFVRENPTIDFYFFASKRFHDEINALALPNLKMSFLPSHQLQEALCAFDYGLLFRYDDATNFFAFPNKASEYLNGRLRIVVDSKKLGCITEPFTQQFIYYKDFNSSKNNDKVSYAKLKELEYLEPARKLVSIYEEI